jgi:hypothetical protein
MDLNDEHRTIGKRGDHLDEQLKTVSLNKVEVCRSPQKLVRL